MTHYVMAYDVIGHYVTMQPNSTTNERRRVKLYVGEVPWPFRGQFRIERAFFPPEFSLKKAEF